MPTFGPIKRADLIRNLRQLGFDGPHPGGNHALMQKGGITIILPNPHQGDIGKNLLARILRQAGITRAEWEQL